MLITPWTVLVEFRLDRMFKLSQTTNPSAARRISASRKLFLFLLLGVFTFQLARAFIVIETCRHDKSTGNTMQHCKDSVEGIVPTPVLAESTPPAVSRPALEPEWGNFPFRLDIREDASLSPFFHPPRKSA